MSLTCSVSGQSGGLDLQELRDTDAGDLGHFVELRSAEHIFFTATLQLDEVHFVGHHDIHVHAGVLILEVIQI